MTRTPLNLVSPCGILIRRAATSFQDLISSGINSHGIFLPSLLFSLLIRFLGHSIFETLFCSSILFSCNSVMHRQTIWLSSLIFATLASATPTYPRKRFPYPHKPVSYPYPTGTGIYPTGTGTSVPWPTTGGTSHTYTPFSTSTALTSSADLPPASTTIPSTTITHPATGTPTSFKVQYQKAYDYPDSPALTGFANLIRNDDGVLTQGYTDDVSSAANFTLNADGSLSVGNLFADLPAQAAYSALLFQTQGAITSQGDYKTYCTLGDDGALGCSTNTGSYYDDDVYFTCGGQTGPYDITVGPTGRPYEDFCYTLSLLAVPL